MKRRGLRLENVLRNEREKTELRVAECIEKQEGKEGDYSWRMC